MNVVDELWDQGWDQVRFQVGHRTDPEIRDQVWRNVADRAWGQVSDQVGIRTERLVRDAAERRGA